MPRFKEQRAGVGARSLGPLSLSSVAHGTKHKNPAGRVLQLWVSQGGGQTPPVGPPPPPCRMGQAGPGMCWREGGVPPERPAPHSSFSGGACWPGGDGGDNSGGFSPLGFLNSPCISKPEGGDTAGVLN